MIVLYIAVLLKFPVRRFNKFFDSLSIKRLKNIRMEGGKAVAYPEVHQIQQVTQMFKMLSDPTRLKILLSLENGERNVTSIAEEVEMEQSAVSHQLKLLKNNRVVKSKRQGKTILYSLDDQHVFDILQQTFEHVTHR